MGVTAIFLSIIRFLLFVSQCDAKSTVQKSDCNALIAGGTAGYYYANSCYIWVMTSVSWTSAKSTCTHFAHGHLAVYPTINEVDKFYNMIIEWGSGSGWIWWVGLFQTNSTDEPAGNWHWTLSDGRSVPVRVIPSEMGWMGGPDGANENCGAYAFADKIGDEDCANLAQYICQYDDMEQERKYRRKFKAHRGNPSSVLAEKHVNDRIACARLCTADPICRSFSYGKTGNCIINQDDGTQHILLILLSRTLITIFMFGSWSKVFRIKNK